MDEQKDKKAQQGPRKLGRRGKGGGMIPKEDKKNNFIIVLDDKYISDPNKFGMNDIVIMNPENKAKGGRAGFKSGSKGCKLAKRGKGRAYGKNS